MSAPLLSIVIANYNYGRFLEEAIQSVVAQKMGNKVELIICDAASTDNSVEIIKKYANGLPPNTSYHEWMSRTNSQLPTHNTQLITWWCSEKDGGQSAAFNKGFARARGKYLTWLNADDGLVAGCLKQVVSEMERFPDCEWFTGNFYRFTQDGRIIDVGWGPHYYPNLLQQTNSPVVVFGPTSFFSKSAWERIGKIDDHLTLIMDTDLWIRFIKAGVKQRRVSCFCWAFRMHSDSKTAEYDDHVIDDSTSKRMKAENDYVVCKNSYKASAFLYILLCTWRLLDGSFAKRAILKQTMKTIKVKGPQ